MINTNAHTSDTHRYNIKPDVREMVSYKYGKELTRERYMEGYTPGISSRSLIYDQSRIYPGPNRFGTRFIRYNDMTIKPRAAGMDGTNSTKQTGKPFFESKPKIMYQQI
jgi:hypothetical protein